MTAANAVNNFAFTELPVILEHEPAELSSRAEAVMRELSPRDISREMGSKRKGVFLLDLKMIEAGIVHQGFTPPAFLSTLIDRYTKDEISGLTYEDLIFINPADQPRAFTLREVRATEVGFYAAHRRIEAHLERVNSRVGKAIRELLAFLASRRRRNERAVTALANIATELRAIVGITASLGLMPKEHFAKFRSYLGTHPIRGVKGPSGAFTAGIPFLELLFRGDRLPNEYLDYLGENWKYLPRHGRKDIDMALQFIAQGWTLLSLWEREGRSKEIETGINHIGNFLDTFRKMHYGAVARQIPEAIRGEIAGTGGENNPGEFLRRRIRDLRFIPFH